MNNADYVLYTKQATFSIIHNKVRTEIGIDITYSDFINFVDNNVIRHFRLDHTNEWLFLKNDVTKFCDWYIKKYLKENKKV